MTKTIPTKISKWYLGQNVIIEPCIEWNQERTLNELNELVIKIKNSLPEYNFVIYPKDSYCYEVNGDWNVCFGIMEYGITFTYMLMCCVQTKKCYGCSFLNTEYINSIGHNSLSEDMCPDIYEDVEDTLYELLIEQKENPVLIDCFEI